MAGRRVGWAARSPGSCSGCWTPTRRHPVSWFFFRMDFCPIGSVYKKKVIELFSSQLFAHKLDWCFFTCPEGHWYHLVLEQLILVSISQKEVSTFICVVFKLRQWVKTVIYSQYFSSWQKEELSKDQDILVLYQISGWPDIRPFLYPVSGLIWRISG